MAGNNLTNPVTVDATGYTPYVDARLERAANTPGKKTKVLKEQLANRAHFLRELAYDETEDYVQHHGKDLLRSEWECRADKKSLYNRVKSETDKIQVQQHEHFLQRKQRLKELIESENIRYTNEEKEVKPSPEEKKAVMLKRYSDIMVNKELERQKVAKEKKELQFRNNCDELRMIISNRICQLVTEEGKELANEKANQQIEKKLEEEMFAEAWINDAKAKDLKDAEEKALKKQKNLEFQEYIKDQMKSHGRNTELPSPIGEDQILKEQERFVELEKEWEKAQKVMKQERLKKDLDRCLMNKFERRAKEVQEDIMVDLYFLEQAIDADSVKKQEVEKKKTLHKEQMEYLDYLRSQIKKEAAYEKEVEKMQQEASDSMWKRREMEWEAERKMRDALNKKALEECHEQIRNKTLKSQEVQEIRRQYAEEIKRQVQIDQKEIEEKKLMTKEKNLKNKEELMKQIAERKEQEQRLKEEKQREWEAFKLAEDEYDKKLKETLANPQLDNLHPRRNSKFS